jgi:hypothetical protein
MRPPVEVADFAITTAPEVSLHDQGAAPNVTNVLAEYN